MKIREVTNKAENLIEQGENAKQRQIHYQQAANSARAQLMSAYARLEAASETDEDGEPVGDVAGVQAEIYAAQAFLASAEAGFADATRQLEGIFQQKLEAVHEIERYEATEEGNLAILTELQKKRFGSNVTAFISDLAARMNASENARQQLLQSMGMTGLGKHFSAGSGVGSVTTNNTTHQFQQPVQETAVQKRTLSYLQISGRIRYLDNLYNSSQTSLAYNSNRKQDWDVVRGRLASEYSSTSVFLTDYVNDKQSEYDRLREEYYALSAKGETPEKSLKAKELGERARELSAEINDAQSRARYAKTMSEELSQELSEEQRTTYVGVGGNSFTTLHQEMIQKQGLAVKDFLGTCGDCSAANTMTALGEKKGEEEVVQRAKALHACVDKKIPSFLPEHIKNEWRGRNGGTSAMDRAKILDSFNFNCENTSNQSLSDISHRLENGYGAIIDVHHAVLNKNSNVSTMNPVGVTHALTITGVEKDRSGKVLGLWIHDTGVWSNMGNAFYCNAQDYEAWKNNPFSTIQYVSKRKGGNLN